MQHDDQEWLRARDVLTALTADGQNPAEVEAMIAAYLRNGQLRARAEAIWKSDARFPAEAWKARPDDAEGGPIPTRNWRYEKASLEDRAQWRFVADRFLATVRLKPRRRIMMKGVSFSKEDLKVLQPKTFGSPADKPKRGKPVETEKRDAAWLAFIDVIHDKARPSGAIETKSDLQRAMYEASNRRGTKFGQRTCEDVASLGFDRLKTYDAI